MVEKSEENQNSNLGYTSKVTNDVIVIGAEKEPVFEQALKDQGIDIENLKNHVTVGTHSGPFHCDEVMACTMLLYTEEYKNAIFIRTRNQDQLNKFNLICDVGGTYEPEKNRYDHH